MANPGQEFFPPLAPDQEKPFFEPHKKPPKDSDSIINYRGSRVYLEDNALEIADTIAERLDEDKIILAIIFNQTINPRSIGPESFFIDDEPLPEEIRFSFNRKGDTIRIILDMSDDYFTLKVQNVASFDGNIIEPVEIDVELEPDQEEEIDQENTAEIEAQEMEN